MVELISCDVYDRSRLNFDRPGDRSGFDPEFINCCVGDGVDPREVRIYRGRSGGSLETVATLCYGHTWVNEWIE